MDPTENHQNSSLNTSFNSSSSPTFGLSPSSSSLTSSSNKVPLDMETSDEWTILSVSPSKDEIRFTKETDFLLHKDDQSDIEEIDESDENLIAGNSSIQLRQSNENIPLNSGQLDNHSDNEIDEIKTDQIESSQRLGKRRRQRRLSYGSTSEGLSNESDIEPVQASLTSYLVGEETSSRMNKEDYEDDIDDTDDELDDEIVNLNLVGKRTRAYTHTPNSNINLKLNLMVCFAITAGIFLGLGNYIGWSTNWRKTKAMMTINNNHVAKLKNLQDELVACMNTQSKETLQESSNNLKVCHQDSDYWKEKFDTLFRENKGLKDILVETQKHYWNTGHHKDIFSPQDCSSGAVADEFHKLKLDLLVKQMEHLQVLKTFEEVKHQEKLSREKLKELEEENTELKAKLIEEEEDDKVISSTLEGRIKQLQMENSKLKQRLSRQRLSSSDESSNIEPSKEATSPDNSSENIRTLEDKVKELQEENIEFKRTLQQLMVQVELAGDYKIPTVSDNDKESLDNSNTISNLYGVNNANTDDLKIDALRQRINSMAQENDELYYLIARLRWSQKPNEDEQEIVNNDENNNQKEEDVTLLEYQIQELQELLNSEKKEVNKWKGMYEEMQAKLESSVTQSNSNSKSEDDLLNPSDNGPLDWLGDIDLSNIVGDSFSSGSKMLVDAMKMIVEKAFEAQAAIPESMHQKINSTMSALNNLQEKMWEKWYEVRRIEYMTENPSAEYQQAMNEMFDTLVASLRKLHDVGTKFATNLKPIPQKIDKLTSKMTKILDGLETKWRKNKEKLYRAGYSEPEDETTVSELEEIDNWYISRAKSRRNNQIYPSKDGDKRSWLFKRARDREALRVKGDHGVRGRGS